MIFGKCALCGGQKKIVFSHIIPEFFYKNLYDDYHRADFFYERWQGFRPKHIQKGLREYLCCKICDNEILGSLEKYSETIFCDKKVKERINYRVQDNNVSLLDKFANIKKDEVELFLLSILWRVIISKDFGLNRNEEFAYLEKSLRNQILQQKLDTSTKIRIVVQSVYSRNDPQYQFIFPPIVKSLGKGRLLRLYIVGFEILFFLPPFENELDQLKLSVTGNDELSIFYLSEPESKRLIENYIRLIGKELKKRTL